MSPASFVEAFVERVGRFPDKVAFRYLGAQQGGVEHPTASVTYRELLDRAKATAARLQAVGGVGDRVVLAHTPGLDFVVDLLACQLAGMAPVPVYPPMGHREIETATAIAGLVRPVAVLSDLAPVAEPIAAGAPGAVVLTADDRDPAAAARWRDPAIGPDTLALLQFTSGSTGAPKGVEITHRNMLANQRRIRAAYGQDEHSLIVSWLPFYHDMGLIGAVLHPLYLGASCVLMSPLSFLQHPYRWLRAISEYGGTISPAPDFAYALCTRKVTDAELASLDLSSWRVAISGGEPVRADTVRRFTQRFSPAGFRPGALVASYGLAESTLLVSADNTTADHDNDANSEPTLDSSPDDDVVGCGAVPDDVVVVGSDAMPVEPGTVGEIWVTGDSVGRGYWERPDLTAAVFGNELGAGSSRRYLRTGDHGFVREGRLFVCGRMTDLLVVRGRNHYPQDIEATVERSSAEIRPGCVAAFLDGERVVVVAEVRDDSPGRAVAAAVTSAVARTHGLTVADVAVVRRGTIPKTSSGKIRRGACRDGYRRGELALLAATTTEDAPTRVRSVLDDAEPIGDLTPTLAALGLDSLHAVGLQHELQSRFGVEVGLGDLLNSVTLRDLRDLTRGMDATLAVPATEPAAPVTGPVPATVGQQAIWLLHQLDPTGRRYLIARAVRIGGDLDVEALRGAIDGAVRRHAALHARVIVAHGTVSFDYESAPPPRLEVAGGSVADAAAAPIDLLAGPPVRFRLVESAEGEPVLVVVAHHIVADLWSMSVLLSEILERYHSDGVARVEPAHGMARYVAAERDLLDGPRAASLRRQWIDLLTPVLDADHRLPTDRPAPTTRTWHGDNVIRRLDASRTAAVRDLACRLRVSPFALLFAGYAMLLARSGNARDLVIGVPTAVRPDAALADTVGYCVNTLPVPVRLPTTGAVADVVTKVAATIRRCLELQRYPLPLIAEAVGARTAGGRPPLFDTMFGWTSAPPGAAPAFAALAADDPSRSLESGPLRLTAVPMPSRTALADLDANVADLGDELVLTLAYATEVFDRATVDAFADRFLRIVDAMIARPDGDLRDLTVVDDAERRRLAALGTGTGPVPRAGATLIDCFLEHADATDPAVCVSGAVTTYAELAARVDRVAAAILETTGGAGTLIGLHLADGPDFVVGMLAILRAGYGFVPLLPTMPAARLEFMARDADVAAIVIDAGTVDHDTAALPSALRLPAVPVDASADPPAAWPVPTPDDVAYVVYTSGTTGDPKGVPITHANVLPLLCWQRQAFGLGPGQRLAQSLALSFDFGLQELFVAVLFGGTVVFPSPRERHSAPAYARFVQRHRITTLYLTPTFANELARAGEAMPSVNTVLLGGEILTYVTVAALRPLLAPDCVYVNGYGPTEASINCSMKFLSGDQADAGTGLVPVGRPTGRSRVSVCDPFGDVAPEGVVGEVVIGGPGVTAGYLFLPDQSARAFEPDPLEPGARRYRTGDLGKMLPDGDLVVLGRRDHQVKIRGFRVEPDEVRSILLRHPRVQDAAVVVRSHRTRPALGAACVAAGITVAQLRAHLVEHVPAHQLPTRLAIVDELPRGAHGKVDSAALQALLDTHPADDGPVELREIEAMLTRVWGDELGTDVNRHDNFFDLGGNSLRVGPVMARIERELGRPRLPMSLLFEFPTLADLARHLGSPAEENLPAPVSARKRRRQPQRVRISFES